MNSYALTESLSSMAEETYAELLNLCFEVPQGQDFLNDFPVWSSHFLDPLQSRRFSITCNDQLVASASIRVVTLRVESPESGLNPDATDELSRTDSLKLRVAILGAVACHPNHRNQGLASELIQRTCRWAHEQEVSAIFLWSSEPALYQRLGFNPFGLQVRCRLQLLLKNETQQSEYQMKQGFNSQIFKLIQRRRGGLELTPKDQLLYAAHSSVQWLYVTRNEEVLAYAGLGRGIDLQDHVHEWGGDPYALNFIFQKLVREQPHTILLSSPGHLNHYFPHWRSLDASESPEDILTQPVIESLCLANFFSSNTRGEQAINMESLPNLHERDWIQTRDLSNGNPMSSEEVLEREELSHFFWFWGLDAS